MKYGLTACAVALASLALAPTALAHHPVGEASQYCDGEKVKLSASFDNPGFETTVTATDSQSGEIGSGTAPAVFTATFPVIERAAGTVTFNWTAAHDSGTLVASYEAVSGCEAPPPPTTTTTTPPPPPQDHHTGGPPHISTAPHGSSPPEAKASQAIRSGKLPFSGLPALPMVLIGAGLLGAGVAARRLSA